MFTPASVEREDHTGAARCGDFVRGRRLQNEPSAISSNRKAMLGVLILEVLGNGVSTFNVPVEVQYILTGVIIIANTAVSHWQRRRTE